MIGAILRAQWLSMRLRGGTRRTGAVFSAFTGLLFYGFWAFLAWGTMLFFAHPENAGYFIAALSGGLLLVMLYWQLAPLISASFGASLDLQKLLVYPIPQQKLFTVEILLRITTCAEMLIVLAGAVIGLLRNPRYGAAASPFILSGALLFAATNILLSAGNRNLVERLLMRARLKEVMFLFMIAVSLLPQALLMMHIRESTVVRFAPSQIVWPWAAVAHFMLRESAKWGVPISVLYVAVAFWFSRWQFERTLRYDPASLKRPERESQPDRLMERLLRFPSRVLPDPIAAIAEKEIRTLVRISRFRLVYAMSCFFGIVMYLPYMRHPARRGGPSFFQQNSLTIICLYGLLMLGQVSYWNCFGFDRSATQGYFSWPLRFRDALLAKNLAIVLFLIPQILMNTVVAAVLHLPVTPAKVMEALAVTIIAFLYWVAMGNICSVRIPHAMNPEKMNQMSNKLQALSIWSAPLLLFPLALAYWGRAVFENEVIFWALVALAGIIGAIFYWVALDSAVNTASNRREAILMQLSHAQGPVSIT